MKKDCVRKLLVNGNRLVILATIVIAAVWLTPLHAGDDNDLGFVVDQVVVKLNTASGAQIADIHATYGTTTLEMLLGSASIYLLQIPPGEEVEEIVSDMEDDPRLIYAEPNFFTAMPEGNPSGTWAWPSGTWAWGGSDPDPYLFQYAADLLNLLPAHAVTQGEGAVVAVLDTGMQLDHPGLASQLTAVRYDFVGDDPVPEDEANGLDDDGDGLVDEGFGHGTHVAGIINLIAPAAHIMPLRVLDSDGQGNHYVIAEAIQYAVLHGASVINLSLGTTADSHLLQDVIDSAAAAGVVTVAAAGNMNSSTPQYPAALHNALAVTAVGPTTTKADFANYGDWIDVAAPGESIVSTFPGNIYVQWSGSSMAAAFISGQAALLGSAFPAANAADLAWLIRGTAQAIDAANPDHAGELGAGLADIGASLSFAPALGCGPQIALPTTADAWINQGSAANNFGTDAILKVKSQSSGDNARALVRFALPAGVPPGCRVESATLRLYAASGTNGRTLHAIPLAANWSESTITWNNQPATMSIAPAVTSSGSGYRQWNVAAQVQAMTDAGVNYGFLIRDAAKNGSGAEQQFHSWRKEEYPPELVIKLTPTDPVSAPALQATIRSAPAALSTGGEAAFIFSANVPGASFVCSLDGAPFAPCASPQRYGSLSAGAHTFAVQALDPAGGADSSPASYSWTVIDAAALPLTTVSCGQTLTGSVRLANSLTNCPGDGLVIGAPGIAVDLNGRTIDGVGLGAGVRNDGFDGVMIANGIVKEFDFGVQLNNGTVFNVVSALTLQSNQEAGVQIAGSGAKGSQLWQNTFIDNGDAVAILGGARDTFIYNNTIGAGANGGLVLDQVTGSWLEGNLFSDANNTAVMLTGAGDNVLIGNTFAGGADTAVQITEGSHGNRVQDNVITAVGDSGIWVEDSDDNQVIANTIHHAADDGIGLDNAHRTIVRDNDLRYNGGGIQLSDATQNLLEANVIVNSFGFGIEVGAGALENVFRFNVSNGNTAVGILVEAENEPSSPQLGNLLDRNTANGNEDSGIHIAKAGHTLTANVANDNDAWGIYAAEGSIDAGNNSAAGNSEPGQCFAISCSGGSPPPPAPEPPDTVIIDGPPHSGSGTTATFFFTGVDNDDDDDPTDDFEFQCRLDSQAEADFAACQSPHTVSNLSVGVHTFEVRAVDVHGNMDPTPASYTWIVEAPLDCGPPVTLIANADAWIEQNSPSNNKGDDSILKVKAQGSKDNFRALVRFPLPASVPPGCTVASATLHLYAASWKNGRTLHAIRLTGAWIENKVTWKNQPQTAGPAAATSSGSGYRQWDVAAQVQAMFDNNAPYGFLIRDSVEGGSGREQQFHSREKGEHPPLLVITFAPAD